MNGLGAIPLGGTTLPGQDASMESLWGDMAPLDSNTDLKNALTTIQSTASRDASISESKPLSASSVQLNQTLDVAEADSSSTSRETSKVISNGLNSFSQSTITRVADTINSGYEAKAANDSLTGVAENAALVGGLAPIQDIMIDFQPDTTAVPAGYIKDIGQAYSDARGFGWVRQDSLSQAIATPLDITPNARDRNQAGIDPRLNTLLHMQYPSGISNPTAVKVPAAWEYALPNGTYNVTVSVGDPSYHNSKHTINVEGVEAVKRFQSSPKQKFKQATAQIIVNDGKLTIDAIGGINTKINYIGILSAESRSADSFIDSIGTNIHLHHGGAYLNYDSIIKPRLLELGIRHVRDGAVDSTWKDYYNRINDLGRAGIKFNLIFDPRDFANLTKLPAFASTLKDGLESFEGPNEYDNSGDPNWVSTLRSYQQSLYKAVKNNSPTANMPVIAPSLIHAKNFNQLGDLGPFLDYGNTHNYLAGFHPGTSGWGANGYGSIDYNLRNSAKVSGGKPVISTETGYHNVVDLSLSHKGTPEEVAGKYLPRVFLEHFSRGVPRTYNYEFINGRDDPRDIHNFGLLRYDGSPKPAFTALKNLISLLKDSGTSFSPDPLNYTLSGNTTNVHKTLLQKQDGSFYLVMWQEVSSYDPNTAKQKSVPSQQVILNLNTPVSSASTYLPNKSTAANAKYASPKQLTLNVPDHPLIVEIIPASK